ncbi:hypothetical protein BK672_08390 [Pseudomonas fluorescens]|uniref:Lipoprotein n=1 Tax=Pseudomonas fluorescens TaxID=294 RepID=A0A423NE81_PSEFL|nr:hypothetical protein [Pseudomonas fluorescens]RON96571.1 hypothetical protein BK672_08390 [Pseudomonas fluorescens]
MHAIFKAIGYGLMIMFVSCGVGAQQPNCPTTPNGSAQEIVRLDMPKPEVASGEWKMPLLNPIYSKQ